MSTTLLLLPADAGTAATAVHVDAQGHVHVHAAGAAPLTPAARTVLVVPGTQVHLRWLALPGRSPAQSLAAARLQLAEHLASDVSTLHVVIAANAQADGTRLVAAVEQATLQQWLERAAQHGIVPDSVVPECLLLPTVDADAPPTVVQWDGRWLVRGARLACSLEPETAQLVLDAQGHPSPLPPLDDPAQVIAVFARHVAQAPIELRQHAFARATPQRRGLTPRRLAWLGVLLLISPLLLLGAQALRYEIGAQLLQRRAVAVQGVQATGATPVSADAFAAQLAAVIAAVDSVPGAELDMLAYQQAQPVRATLVHDDDAQLQQLLARLRSAGWQVRPASSQAVETRLQTPLELEPPR
ncbi:type II secretion system protein GspL [Xanthomonas campestris]|jgi:general secretion pathway protein L|uniref:Type II secretion system protein L n=1 Tax=Xanthomonas campestris pv. campestris (strain ATCC 33913 / DSM 3586 / NCPPB 528 / LMG 568 / P 25) TaxID=190485 RepID=Q8P5C4_XANCP|nr:type II secretion system protein GspL [Xanthomonas campestris]AAM42687.1 type II secretion system protein L [Xanthomonas campestris pv. campestris str. ATCC 33913]MCC5050963.1 type II secretion system protein GspL [Xanthomonas campestris pv. aberrans]MCC5076894.1 type II secretion system protein GspL [Xanthomonas campestris pv. campestris]MCF8797610.1 type II secretion system protein GspL [Xanthomonas campestris pv. campestris]MCF8813724.1 type II secretion system protein GspL [Xanthomonas 